MRHALAACALCWLGACGGTTNTQTAEARPTQSAVQASKVRPEIPKGPPVQDAMGNLIASGEQIAWLDLPRGLKRVPTAYREQHFFTAQGIAIDRVQSFFGARLASGKTERMGKDGVSLQGCVPPSGPAPKQTVLDVSVLEGNLPGEVHVHVNEHPYIPANPQFRDVDARNLLKAEQKRAE